MNGARRAIVITYLPPQEHVGDIRDLEDAAVSVAWDILNEADTGHLAAWSGPADELTWAEGEDPRWL